MTRGNRPTSCGSVAMFTARPTMWDYLENKEEGKTGLDWFRFEVVDEKPILVYFQLDLLDRDVSANLRVYSVDSRTGRPEPYLQGKDPMEIVHDRERERYSKHICRTFFAGRITSRSTPTIRITSSAPGYCPCLRTTTRPRRSRPGCTTSSTSAMPGSRRSARGEHLHPG